MELSAGHARGDEGGKDRRTLEAALVADRAHHEVRRFDREAVMPGAMGPRLRRMALEIRAEELAQVGLPAAVPAHGKDQPAGREGFAHHARGNLELMDLVSDGRSDRERAPRRLLVARHPTDLR